MELLEEAPSRVLLIGGDQPHLDARVEVMEHFWTVMTALADETLNLETDLVVVCETIPEPMRQDLVERVRGEAPTMLVVKVNGFDSGPRMGADATVDEVHGPGALVSTIYELLTERGLPSRGWPEETESGWLQ